MEDSYVLISDVDGTLLGDDHALEAFADWLAARRHRVKLVYNSGRLVESVLESVATTALPVPDAVIGGVGTQIRTLPDGQEVPGWLERIAGWYPAQIVSTLAAYDELELQPAEFLAEHKISYYARSLSSQQLGEMKARLKAASCEVELVYSSSRDLDVLPRGVDKGSAAAYLAAHWQTGHDRVIVSGDSGNDMAMFQTTFRGIVVGNAHPELRKLDSPTVYRANRDYAGGVLEGLIHWGVGDSAAP